MSTGKKVTVGILISLFFLGGFSGVSFGEWPTKPVTVVVSFAAGGGSDTQARLIAKYMDEKLGNKVIVTNKPGAGGAVAAAYISNTKTDGYTLGWTIPEAFTFAPQVGEVPYTPDDFTYISGITKKTTGFISVKDERWSDYQGMLDWAKKSGKPLKFASTGAIDRMFIKEIEKKENIKINIIPVKGGAGSKKAVLGAHVDFGHAGSKHFAEVKAGMMQLLAVFTGERHPAFPEVPTLQDLGYDLKMETYDMIFGPKDMPEDIVQEIAAAFKQATENNPDFQTLVNDRIRAQVNFLGPQEIDDFINQGASFYKKLIANTK